MAGALLATAPLGFPWQTLDPFLFCAHHDDAYPAGNATQGVDAAALAGRNVGSDFTLKDGWRMYHGRAVPGFPRHPHRGFETVTLAREGFIDHSDTLGATARFGQGDVQWITTGRGLQHCEMFPLVNEDRGNRTELFQIWLNLPAHNKMVEPHFRMMWSESVPRKVFRDEAGKTTEVVVMAGSLAGTTPPPPPPSSWAANPANDVQILTVRMAPGARWTLPGSKAGANRVLYSFRGERCTVDGQPVTPPTAVQLRSDVACALVNTGGTEAEFLLLHGRPIGEPVARHGPFVMNTRQELQQAYDDYRRTGFGSWQWNRDDPVHPRTQGRFAVHADGSTDTPS